jgi:hypothetical protein
MRKEKRRRERRREDRKDLIKGQRALVVALVPTEISVMRDIQ